MDMFYCFLLLFIIFIRYPFFLSFIFSFIKENKILLTGNTLILIAHPDDDYFFFYPLIQNYKTLLKGTLTIICLSKCNKIREEEIKKVCKIKKINLKFSNLIDNKNWNPLINLEINKIKRFCNKKNIKNIFTFSKKGVTNHKGHIFCYKVIYKIKLKVKKFYLEDLSLFSKYIFPIYSNNNMLEYFIINNSLFQYFSAFKDIYYYKSQITWYRILNILFSRYFLINKFIKDI